MKKEDAIRIITTCAKKYHEQLEQKNLMFIFGSHQQIYNLETAFFPKNFLHLTGVIVNPNTFKGSSNFYQKCLKGRLSPRDFQLTANGTTEMKLSVLPKLMQIQTCAKMVGDYNFNKSLLVTDKIAGNVTACMGFIQEKGIYIPNTALREDIRDITDYPTKRVLAVYKKSISERQYDELCYLAKSIDITELNLPISISQKIQDSAMQQGRKSIHELLKEPRCSHTVIKGNVSKQKDEIER